MNTGSLNDHYKWGWGDEWYCSPKTPKDRFKVSFTSAGTCGSFHDEVVNALTALVNKFNKPVMVCLSGGLDSQVICLALNEMKVPFVAMTKRWLTDDDQVINVDDVEYSIKFCEMHNIKHLVQSGHISHFLNNSGAQMAEAHGFCNYRLLTHAHFGDQFKNLNTVIVGDGNVTFDIHHDELVLDVPSTVAHQYFLEHNIEGTEHFFKYTPELILSQLDHPVIHSFMDSYQYLYETFKENSKTPHLTWRLYSSFVKPLVYQANWEGLLHRSKQHGFENYDDSKWKKHIGALGSKRYGNYEGIEFPAKEFIDFLKLPKGETRVWYK